MHKETMIGFLRIFSRFAKDLKKFGPRVGLESFNYVPGEGMELRISESAFNIAFDRFRVEMAENGEMLKVYYLEGLKIAAVQSKGDADGKADVCEN